MRRGSAAPHARRSTCLRASVALCGNDLERDALGQCCGVLACHTLLYLRTEQFKAAAEHVEQAGMRLELGLALFHPLLNIERWRGVRY